MLDYESVDEIHEKNFRNRHEANLVGQRFWCYAQDHGTAAMGADWSVIFAEKLPQSKLNRFAKKI